ncbi:MAG: branched-chain amino acid ABC transporter permease [Bacillota bacterium]
MVIVDLLIGAILRGGIYVSMAMGLSLVFGVMKIPSFAHGEFYMLGAYFMYFASVLLGLPPILCIIVAAIGGFVAGVITEKLTLRPLRKRSKGDWIVNSFLLTAGISIIMQNLAQALIGVNYRGVTEIWHGSVGVLGTNITFDKLFGFLIAMGTVGFFWLFLKKTKTGNAILAVSEHETGAMLVGIDLNKIHTLTFALSSMLAAIAGAVLLSLIPAYPFMGITPLYKSWFVVILVGLGNVQATIVGGFMVAIIETLAAYSLGTAWQDVVSLSIIILVLLFKPTGIFGKSLKV